MKVEREKALEHKQRMSRMMEDKENFVSKITAARSFIYEVGPRKPSKVSLQPVGHGHPTSKCCHVIPLATSPTDVTG